MNGKRRVAVVALGDAGVAERRQRAVDDVRRGADLDDEVDVERLVQVGDVVRGRAAAAQHGRLAGAVEHGAGGERDVDERGPLGEHHSGLPIRRGRSRNVRARSTTSGYAWASRSSSARSSTAPYQRRFSRTMRVVPTGRETTIPARSSAMTTRWTAFALGVDLAGQLAHVQAVLGEREPDQHPVARRGSEDGGAQVVASHLGTVPKTGTAVNKAVTARREQPEHAAPNAVHRHDARPSEQLLRARHPARPFDKLGTSSRVHLLPPRRARGERTTSRRCRTRSRSCSRIWCGSKTAAR